MFNRFTLTSRALAGSACVILCLHLGAYPAASQCRTVTRPFGFETPQIIDFGDRYSFVAAEAATAAHQRLPLRMNAGNDADIVAVNATDNRITILRDIASTLSVQDLQAGAGIQQVHAADIDNDGDQDLFAVNQASFSLIRRNAAGGFDAPTTILNSGASGQTLKNAALADFNQDGLIDVAATYRLGLLPGYGTFAALRNVSGSLSGAWVNYAVSPMAPMTRLLPMQANPDQDLNIDFVTTNFYESTPLANYTESVLRFINFSSGASVNFTTGPADFNQFHMTSSSVAVADFDGDGRSDIVASRDAERTVAALFNQGDRTFLHSQSLPSGGNSTSLTLAAGDMDLDSRGDFIVANRSDRTLVVYRGNADRSFSSLAPHTLSFEPSVIELGDIDADGDRDVIVAGAASGLAIIKNTRRQRVCLQVKEAQRLP